MIAHRHLPEPALPGKKTALEFVVGQSFHGLLFKSMLQGSMLLRGCKIGSELA